LKMAMIQSLLRFKFYHSSAITKSFIYADF
jgi:hypothetical protein